MKGRPHMDPRINYKALVLDESYFPVQIIDWRHAIRLFFSGRAEIVEHHENAVIRSPSQSFKLPKVMRIFQKVLGLSCVKFNRHNIFLRDNFTCQYCGTSGHPSVLSLDHVIPKSRGGKSDWQNIVTACFTCNNFKSDRLPDECGLKLRKIPARPDWGPLWGIKLSHSELEWWENWMKGRRYKNVI